MVSKLAKNLSILLFLSLVLVACSNLVDAQEDVSNIVYEEEEDVESLLANQNQDVASIDAKEALLEEKKNEENAIVLPKKNQFLADVPEVSTPNLLAVEEENKEYLKDIAIKENPAQEKSVEQELLNRDSEIAEESQEDNPYFSEVNESTPSPLKEVSSRIFSLMAKKLITYNNFDIEDAIEKAFEEKIKPVVVDNVDIQADNLIYSNNLLETFIPVARSKFIFKSDINIKNIQAFAGYIDTQLVVVKRFYNPDDKNYVYDVVFLQGDLKNTTNLWNLNLDNALKIEDTLEKEKIIKLDDYVNVGYSAEYEGPDTQEDIGLELDDEKDTSLNANEDFEAVLDENGDPILDENGEAVLKPLLRAKNISKKDTKELEKKEKVLTLAKEIELQKKLLKFRTTKLVGLWEDVITGEVVEIRQIDGDKNRRNKIYGAFVVDAKYFKDKQPKINDMFVWNKGDLRFLFSTISYNDYYLDEEKMLVKTSIVVQDAKALIIISLPNRKYRYFKPVIEQGLLAEVEKEMYGEIKRTVKNINTSHIYKTPHKYQQTANFEKSWVGNVEQAYAKFSSFFGLMTVLGSVIVLALIF